MTRSYDAFLLVSFGGPEGRDEVLPFLENVLRGKPVPEARKLEVAEHYYHFDGVSPINAQNRVLIEKIRVSFTEHGIDLPIYWGNRNWHPLLTDTLAQMRSEGVRNALAFVTSAFSSYSGCRQYSENITSARAEVGEGAPAVDNLRRFYNHPLFVDALEARLRQALASVPNAVQPMVLFSAHSIPVSMADGCAYVAQLNEVSCELARRTDTHHHRLVYQSRSGPPSMPWLEPDVNDAIREAHSAGFQHVVLAPIGFVSDHMEVLYDLDVEAKATAAALGVTVHRMGTVGEHPLFVQMISELVLERLDNARTKRVFSGSTLDVELCTPGCCMYHPRR